MQSVVAIMTKLTTKSTSSYTDVCIVVSIQHYCVKVIGWVCMCVVCPRISVAVQSTHVWPWTIDHDQPISYLPESHGDTRSHKSAKCLAQPIVTKLRRKKTCYKGQSHENLGFDVVFQHGSTPTFVYPHINNLIARLFYSAFSANFGVEWHIMSE